MLTFVYLPYAHYQEKIKVKQVIREVSQWINEARNMAINGFDQKRTDWSSWDNGDTGINKSIGLYFENGDKKGEMYFYAYPFTLSWSLAFPGKTDQEIYRINEWRAFPKGAQFDGAIWEIANWELNNILFFFQAITWESSYYTIGWWVNPSNPISADKIELNFSYKGSSSDVLKKSLIYDTRINTIDF